MKPTQAASEIKPILTKQAYINKLNRKLKSVGKDAANGLKKEPGKPWWAYSVGWRNLAQRLKMPQKVLQEKFLNERIMSLTTSPINNQIKNVNLSPDMEIIKITTGYRLVEAIRQKRQKIAQMSEVAENIQAMIGKKRSKRSSHESRKSSTTIKNSRRAGEKKTVVSNKKSRYSKSRPRKEQTDSKSRNSSEKKEVADLKTANSAIPSTVFYKRIWEYINGTRPHSDIIGDYNSLGKNSEKDNSTCTDNDRIATSQSQNDKSQVISPNVKPERDFYKRIWDIINATQTYENSKIRSKRDANIEQSDAASTPLCIQEQTDDYEQLTNEKRSLDIADTINPSEISDPDSYISGFWSVANNTQWQPKTAVPLLNAAAKLNDDLTLRPLANIASASEVDDLNKFPDKVEQVDYSSSDNSTGHNSSQEIITDPGPPYSSEESFATSLYLPIERAVDKAPREEDRKTPQAEENHSSTTPNYDPSKIPYVEISDYSDQQEDKSNQSATAAKYKEYDDDDYGVEQLYNIDAPPSKSPNAEIKVEPTESEDEPEISLDANDSRSRCAESKDSPKECADKYDVEDTKLRNNTEDGADVRRSAEDPAEISSSEESENSDFVHFDINEYRKPFNLDEFFKNDPLFKSIRAAVSREYAKYDYEEEKNPPPRTEGSEEVETYATDPKERSQDYFAKNEEREDIASDDKDKTEEETDSYEKKETKESEVNDEDYYPYDGKDFFKRIFEKDKDNDKESSDAVDTEKEFLSRYFTEDVLSQLRDNSTAEEDRQKEESRNKEEIHKTLSKILDKKDQFSRLDDNLNKMVEKGETIPIKYNNYWSLEYESPRRRKAEEEANEGAEEAEEA